MTYLLEGKPAPDHATIARFLSVHFSQCSKKTLAEVTEVLLDIGEISGVQVFIDGTKMESVAGRYTFVWKKAVTKFQNRLAERIAIFVEGLELSYGICFIFNGTKFGIRILKKIRKRLYWIKEEEGIIFKTLNNPVEILGNDEGMVCGMKCVEMELGEPDESGRRRPVEKPDSEFVLDVDSVIMSIGTSPNPLIRSTTPGLEANNRGCLITKDESGLTTRDNVYAGGDAVTGAATVILAMGAGKAAAKAIDEALRG